MSQVVFKKKRKLSEIKAYTIKNCKDDFNMSLDLNIAFDADPPREVIFGLMEIISANADLEEKREESLARGETWDIYAEVNEKEIKRRNELYYGAATQLIFDVDIEGLSFDNPQETEASFENEKLPLAFLYNAVTAYLMELFNTHAELKKIMQRASELENSGESKKNEESQSQKQPESESDKASQNE